MLAASPTPVSSGHWSVFEYMVEKNAEDGPESQGQYAAPVFLVR
jgi:hypothetical protein